jgi:hypothetical protein
MSSIPTNVITVNFPDDGGGGGGDSNADIRSIMETLRHVQAHIASINTNVRSILETLRRCCARGGMRPGGGGGGGGRGGGMSEAERSMRGNLNRSFGAAMIEARYTSRMNPRMTTRDILHPTHYNLLERFMSDPSELSASEQARGARLRAFDLSVRARNLGEAGRNASAGARIAARQQAAAARQQAAAARQQAADAAAAAAAATAAAGRRMQGGMAARIDELRRRAAMPGATVASLGLTAEEQAVLSGQASPSGLPGTRAHARAVAGVVAGVQAANAPQQGGGGVIAMVTGIGRVVATMNLIVGLIKTGIDAIMWGSRQTRSNISGFSRLDPFMAKLNTGMMLSDMFSEIQTARDPNVRMAMSKYANAQISNTAAFQGMKNWWTQETAEIGKFGTQIGTLGSILGGGAENMSDMDQWKYLGSFFYPWGEDVRDKIDSKYATQRIAEMRGAGNAMFLNDLNAMTGGRFQADLSATVSGGGRNNWWTGRGNY